MHLLSFPATFATVNDRHHLWILGDGKPGHENQSLGLADALARLRPVEIHRIAIERRSGIIHRLRSAHEIAASLPKPQLIIAAGHRTHPALLTLSRRYSAPAVVIMKPSLPLGLFDLCIAPAHDYPFGTPRKNVVLSRGALNRVPPPSSASRIEKLILIGGPSKHHDWDENALIDQIAEVAADDVWTIADSRRTPDDFLPHLAQRLPQCELVPHGQTTATWLPAKLSQTAQIWVTEDSVSMIYEALSSGAQVGLLSLPRRQNESRVLAGLEQLDDDGFVTSLTHWQRHQEMKTPPEILREADRCASLVAARWL